MGRMSVGRRIALNTTLMIAKQALLALLGVAFVGYLARRLGVADWGELQASIALASMVTVVAGIGVRGYLAREVAERPELGPGHLGAALAIRGLSGAALLGLTAAAAPLFSSSLGVTLFVVAAASQLAALLYSTAWLSFEAHERLQYIAYAEVSARLLVIVLTVTLLALGGGVIAAAIALAVGNLVELGVTFWFLLARFYRPVLRCGLAELTRIARRAVPIGLVATLLLSLQQTDRVLLRRICGAEAVGVYSAAWVLSEQLRMLPDVFLGASFAAGMRLFAGDRAAFAGLYRGCMAAALLLGMPIAAGAALIAPDLIHLVYGEDRGYGPAAGVLQLLVLQVPLAFVFQVASLPLIAARREVALVKLLVAALCTDVTVSVALMPRYGPLGAAVGALSATVLTVTGSVALTWSWVRMVELPRVGAIVAATGVMTAAAYGARALWGMWAAIAVGAVTYAALALGLRAISRAELFALLRRKDPASPPSAAPVT